MFVTPAPVSSNEGSDGDKDQCLSHNLGSGPYHGGHANSSIFSYVNSLKLTIIE